MKYYLLTIGNFRNMAIESSDPPELIRDYIINKLGWPQCTVRRMEFSTIHDIPKYADRNLKQE